MGMLDRLLGDLVAGSTNLPPHVTRNLVRRAGGWELLGQEQVVIKTLEANYRRVACVAGATILGEGRVVLILDVGALVRIAHERQQ